MDNNNGKSLFVHLKKKWNFQLRKIKKLEKQGIVTKKDLIKHLVIDDGYAEQEGEVLYIYGNACESMLKNKEFHKHIKKVNFLPTLLYSLQYIRFTFNLFYLTSLHQTVI